MTHWERLQAVLAGDVPDRTPVAAWRHFPGREHRAEDLVAATLAFQAEYDWDLVKLQPSAVHFAEAWGAEYDYSQYQGVQPRVVRTAAAGPADLAGIRALPGDAGPFGTQLAVIRALRRAWGPGVPLVQTVFSPLSVVELLLGRLRKHRSESRLPECIAGHADALHQTTSAVSSTLADYCARLLDAGADGIFFAVTGLAKSDYLTQAEYAAFGRPYDLPVLAAVQGARVNVLHICGGGVYFDDFRDYPVQVLSWASRQPGNPPLAEALDRTAAVLMAGVAEKETFLSGTPDAVAAAVTAARAATGGRRLIVAPECSYDPGTPAANIRALRDVVDT